MPSFTRSLTIPAAALLLSALVPTGAFAQAQAPAPEKPGISARWASGVNIESDGGDNSLQFGGLVQFDGRFAPNDPLQSVTDTFTLRRVRPILQGRAGKYFEFKLMPDFAGGTLVLFDAYIDMKFSKSFAIRAGKDKTPIGLEQLYADYGVLFPERTLVTNLVPNRDLGVQVRGNVGGGVFSYIGAVFNGINDGTNGDNDTNSAKDIAGRATVEPFRPTGGPLRGFGVAIAGARGHATGSLPSFKSTAQSTFFSYATAVSADPNGQRTRVSPSAYYYYKPIGAFAEYVRSTQAVKTATTVADLAHEAWEVTGSVVVTGETATANGVAPKRPFDPEAGNWGALQLVARYSKLTLDPATFTRSLAASGSSRSAEGAGVSAVWYANAYVKYVLSFERTTFDDPSNKRQPERAVVFRLQFNLQPTL